MKNRVYIFPMKSVEKLKSENPYILHLSLGLSSYFNIVNYGKQNNWGVLNIPKYLFKSDYFYFNWIEGTSIIQGLFFVFLFPFFKLFNKKVIWTHHNIHPHRSNNWMNRFLNNLLKKKSDFIIIHTKESYRILNLNENNNRILYFFHPFFSDTLMPLNQSKDKVYDLLIWGKVRDSKGLEVFLEFLFINKMLDDFKIKIIGKFESEQYFSYIKSKYSGKQISYENKYASDEELNSLHNLSKFVFFPYTGSSVLNSGALIYSLSKSPIIIGPDVGAFKEMKELGYINTYKNFDNVLSIIKYNQIPSKLNQFESFFYNHSWSKFAYFLYSKWNQ